MAEWCMAHPWMTFWLALLVIISISEALYNIVVVIAHWIERKEHNENQETGRQSE